MTPHIFVQTQILRRSTFTPPIGLIVHDIPMFLVWVCEQTGYYGPDFQRWQHRVGSDHCVAWAFPSASVFVRGGQYTASTEDGRRFHIRAEIGAGLYRTVTISLEGLMLRDVLSDQDTFIAKKDEAESFAAKAKPYLEKNRDVMLERCKDRFFPPKAKSKKFRL